jgi:hypothetical protein
MRQSQAAVLALLLGVGGCFTAQPEAPPLEARGHVEGLTGDDVVQLDIALVDRPDGDRFLNHELWELADEQGVSLEHKPILEDNGFRVCQIGGLPPAGLQALLTSPRSCPDPHRVRLHAGSATAVLLGPLYPRCSFRLEQDGRATEVDLEQAQCLLEVVPTLGEEGKVQLRFTPHVRHGQPALTMHPVQDPAGPLRWEWESQQPEEAYPGLGWEVSVAANEYVVVGTWLERVDSLGQRCFLARAGAALVPIQRLLVIRTARASDGAPVAEALSRSPPLALRASWTSGPRHAP